MNNFHYIQTFNRLKRLIEKIICRWVDTMIKIIFGCNPSPLSSSLTPPSLPVPISSLFHHRVHHMEITCKLGPPTTLLLSLPPPLLRLPWRQSSCYMALTRFKVKWSARTPFDSHRLFFFLQCVFILNHIFPVSASVTADLLLKAQSSDIGWFGLDLEGLV